MSKTLDANVRLTNKDKTTITSFIVNQRNIVQACKYADIHFSTFKVAVEGHGVLKPEQRSKLLEFCGRVKAIA